MEDWKCKHCGQSQGIDICDLVPQYWQAKVIDGKAHYAEDTGEFFYDGSELDAVRCLNCREVVEIEIGG